MSQDFLLFCWWTKRFIWALISKLSLFCFQKDMGLYNIRHSQRRSKHLLVVWDYLPFLCKCKFTPKYFISGLIVPDWSQSRRLSGLTAFAPFRRHFPNTKNLLKWRLWSVNLICVREVVDYAKKIFANILAKTKKCSLITSGLN